MNKESMIGKEIWCFDVNRRVYQKGPDGQSCGSPIWAEHWVPCKIVGETSRSWITSRWDKKVPKKGYDRTKWAFSKEEVDLMVWANENRWKIINEVERLNQSPELLRKVAEVIGYKG